MSKSANEKANNIKMTRNALLMIIATFALGRLAAEKPEILTIGQEYHLTFEDGESIRNAKVLSVTDRDYEVQIRGLTERIKVERSTVVSAERVRDQPPVEAPRQPVFNRFEVQALIDANFGLAAFQNLDSFFPAVGIGLNAYLSQALPYVRINALHAELTAMQITDGERTINALNGVATARYLFQRGGFIWYSGIGGGIAALSLQSYSFSRTSYAMLGRVEFGANRQLSQKISLSLGLTGTYWQDNLELLISVAGQVGVAYQF